MSSDLLFSTQVGPFYPFRCQSGTVDADGGISWTLEATEVVAMVTDIDIAGVGGTAPLDAVTLTDLDGLPFWADSSFDTTSVTYNGEWRGLRFVQTGEGIICSFNSPIGSGPRCVHISGFLLPGPMYQQNLDS